MAGEPDGSLGSEAMEATPALDPTSRTHEPASLTDALEHESTDVDQISIGQRLTPAAHDPVDRRPAGDHLRSSCT